MNEPLSFFDRPNSYIGKTVPRPNAKRLLEGRGRFVDDITLPRMVHAAFLRSPYAHARIDNIDISEALKVDGVVRILTGKDIIELVEPFVGVLSHLVGLRSAPQPAVAVDVARWQGEPVVMIIAQTRAQAEDAANLIDVSYTPLPVAADMENALEEGEPVIHSEFDSNLAWQREVVAGDVDSEFANPENTVVERTLHFGRHTGVTLEPRTCLAQFDPSEDVLTVHYSGQAPHMMQVIFAKHLGMAEENVNVVAGDVGGSFGIKVHTYGDEVAVAAVAKFLRRPVKFVADRLESFQSDIHARDHRVDCRMAVDSDGKIKALEFDDLTGIGPYSVYPRTSAIEANQVLNLTGAPYDITNYKANAKVVFQNKNVMCQYRAVGHPVAMVISEALVDEAAIAINMDPVEIRRRNIIPDDAYPFTSPTGMRFADLSHQQCLEKLIDLMDYEQLRLEQQSLRDKQVYRGIGIVNMVEVTNPSPMFYGVGGAPISAQDGAVVRLDASGSVHIASSVTEQGQGTEAILAQVVADAVGVDISRVKVTTGDTRVTPYGGGTWASRAAGIGGEAALQAGKALRVQILDAAATILQTDAASIDVEKGEIVDKSSGAARISLADLGRTIYYRGNELPNDVLPELIASRHFRVTDYPFVFTNGAMATYLEVDPDTGFIELLDFWVVEDCGRVINPKLVDEQIRGGVVQGIGGALYEQCLYSDEGQLLTTTMADYLVPMAYEMPDIKVDHVETPTRTSELGAKGAGEAGTGGAPAAILNAVNDALRPLSARIDHQPISPERVLKALGKV
ncbi:MAG: xanthine dehydrogenase family protein molybdopterin-binding subunit [Methyloligellaceae bacterium]